MPLAQPSPSYMPTPQTPHGPAQGTLEHLLLGGDVSASHGALLFGPGLQPAGLLLETLPLFRVGGALRSLREFLRLFAHVSESFTYLVRAHDRSSLREGVLHGQANQASAVLAPRRAVAWLPTPSHPTRWVPHTGPLTCVLHLRCHEPASVRVRRHTLKIRRHRTVTSAPVRGRNSRIECMSEFGLPERIEKHRAVAAWLEFQLGQERATVQRLEQAVRPLRRGEVGASGPPTPGGGRPPLPTVPPQCRRPAAPVFCCPEIRSGTGLTLDLVQGPECWV